VSDQISRAKKIDQLPRTVIVVVGTNDMRWISRPVTKARMRSLVKQIGPRRDILWVNTYSSGADRFTRPKERWFNRQLRKLARRHDNVTIVDWSAQARTRGVRFDDGLHYRPKGRRLMAEVISDALNRSQD
jgi:lysophospholipase L1-like esterase